MKLGFSLSPHLLRGEPRNEAEQKLLNQFGSSQELLKKLQSHGVKSIELRYIYREEKQNCEKLFSQIWEQGLEITIHGRIEGTPEGARFVDHYPSLHYALQHYQQYQERLVMTLHAYHAMNDASRPVDRLSEATVRQLQIWLRQISDEGLNIFFAVELTRKLAEKTDPGASIDTLVRLVEQVDHDHCGICWDMGHYYSNTLRDLNVTSLPVEPVEGLPPSAFLNRTFHTHIHGLSDRCRTHFPMTPQESLPLELYVQALSEAGYTGVYNLELDFPRFIDRPDFLEASFTTLDRLSKCMQSSS